MEGTPKQCAFIDIVNDNIVVHVPNKFKIGRFPLEYVYNHIENSDLDLSFKQFMVIVKKSIIDDDSSSIQYKVLDEYPDNIIFRFQWEGILSGHFE